VEEIKMVMLVESNTETSDSFPWTPTHSVRLDEVRERVRDVQASWSVKDREVREKEAQCQLERLVELLFPGTALVAS
jgi:hypothetical protein